MLAQVVLFDGFDPLDVIGPYETLTGWVGPRRGSISRLIEREVAAQKALEVETLFAHERRGTAWRAA